MANYSYDEAGNMAAYFILTFLLIVLVPISLPTLSKSQSSSGCTCEECIQHRNQIRKLESGSVFSPKHHKKSLILVLGWGLFGFLAYKVATTENIVKVYNPFEILGLSSGAPLKVIKSQYKTMAKAMHPDKVKLAVNETIEAVEARFVEVTKAYKALTDETIRQNWERYGHPDGRQEISMGIALPKWVVEGKNSIWVLGAYGVIFGVALPFLVGNWWFGSRQKTKDGVNARSAATYFKMLSEDSGMDDVLSTLGKSYEWERPDVAISKKELTELEAAISEKLGDKWTTLRKNAEVDHGHERRRVAFDLLYAHLLRLPLSPSLQVEQAKTLVQSQALLSSLLNICISRNWLTPTLAAMRLQSYLAQGLNPGQTSLRYAQLPGISESESEELVHKYPLLADLIFSLEEKADDRAREVKKVASKWCKLDLVDASFQVIDDRVVTPSSIVYLVVKARLIPPTSGPVQSATEHAKNSEKRDQEFLASKKDMEDIPAQTSVSVTAHAPHWPANRKPAWWVVLADPKQGKVVVPPMRITDIPYAEADKPEVYRSYKLQFQAPPNVMSFPWRVYVISDTFVGEEVAQEITLRIDDLSVLEGQVVDEEDDISDPEEDSLAGQMAMMRGGSVKKRDDDSDEDDDESSTDDDEHQSDSSDSDSD
ncbi:DnaJ-domain-containing protein [Cristinia sonorae]|uniref:DnaJ-domain-containing protein n=1 Tax=Cristinia sonorae TaxID=1940300 RepID=A0A8K0UWN9_9AGAR|nr:DnaJ-domain-containing protein [Cristinia sonorae]